MDAKNQQDRAKMVEEAVSRMCRLGMMPQVITKFRKQGTVLKSETAGILYDLNDEEKKAVADWEEESGGIVYAAILSNMVFPRYENDPGQNGSLCSWWRCSFGRCVPESERNQKLASGCKRVEKIIG